MPTTLFNNIASSEKLGIFSSDSPQYHQIAGILNLDKGQMSLATGVAKDKMRFDSKMSGALKERLIEIGNVIELVGGHFGGDIDKTTRWFRFPNPALGNISPRDMIRFGRYKKLTSFITTSFQTNEK